MQEKLNKIMDEENEERIRVQYLEDMTKIEFQDSKNKKWYPTVCARVDDVMNAIHLGYNYRIKPNEEGDNNEKA